MITGDDELQIRYAGPGDAAEYSAFSRRLSIETFAAENDPVEFEKYLNATFGPALQADEIADPRSTILLGEVRGRIAAYSYLRDADVPPSVRGRKPLQIARFYVDGKWQGRGIALLMMERSAREALRLGAETLWLSVWERNPRAIAFYGKCGFEEVGSQVFMVGNDAQSDRLLSAPPALVLERLSDRRA